MASKKVVFAQGPVASLATPGAFHWWGIKAALTPKAPHYKGKVVVLVNYITGSDAEFTAMAFRAAGATIVGSQTAGADGNVSKVPLPGGLFTRISGVGVFYPNEKPTQRAGIVPDVVVKPTIADIREGRDPVLAKAIRLIVGPGVSIAKIQQMYQTPASNAGHGH